MFNSSGVELALSGALKLLPMGLCMSFFSSCYRNGKYMLLISADCCEDSQRDGVTTAGAPPTASPPRTLKHHPHDLGTRERNTYRRAVTGTKTQHEAFAHPLTQQ